MTPGACIIIIEVKHQFLEILRAEISTGQIAFLLPNQITEANDSSYAES